jgi:hypothetical protein
MPRSRIRVWVLLVAVSSFPSMGWAQNTPPTMTISTEPTPIPENGTRVFQITIIDDAPQNVILSVIGSSAELTPPSAFTITGTGAQRIVTYAPPFDRFGTVTSVVFNLWDPPFPNPTYQGAVTGLTIAPVTAVPRAPTNINSAAGAQATLSWTPAAPGAQSDLPSHYLIEIGDAPGLTAFLPFRIPARTSGVPLTLPNAGYNFRLRPGNRLGTGAVSAEGSVGLVSGPGVPGPPSGLSISLDPNNLATATWSPPGFGAPPVFYIIEVGTAAGLSDVGRFPVPPVFSASGSLPPGTYAVRIRGINIAGEGPATPDVFLTFPGGSCSTPTAPQLGTILRNGPTVMAPWTAPPTGAAQGYRLVAGSTPGAADIGVLTVSPSSSYYQLAPPPGAYHVFIQALSSCGTSAPSNFIEFVEPPLAIPGPPRSLSGTTAPAAASLQWHPPVTGSRVTSYVLEAGSAPGAPTIFVTLEGNSPGIGFTGVPAGTYFVRMKARNSAGTSTASNEIVLTVP